MYGGESWASLGPLETQVNDVVFRQYHLFRAEVRILSGDEAGTKENAPDSRPAGAPAAAPMPTPIPR
jgi:hypothetical protein